MVLIYILVSVFCVTAFADTGTTDASGWIKDGSGWRYAADDGSYITSAWLKAGKSWYHFGDDSYMQTGWQKISGKWYYFAGSGVMQTLWQKIHNNWYYFASNGAMQTGWQKIDGTWYYFKSGGSMTKGWAKVKNQWYYFSSGGAMQTGWVKLSGTWYYLNPSGAMVTGWNKIGKTWYFFDGSGAMITTKIRIAICGKNLSETYQTDDEIWDMMETLGAEITKVDSTADPSAFDGLLVPGGLDIHPQLYGEEDYACNYTDIDFDKGQLAVIDKFVTAGKPILGVCRGFQLLNVYFGGTLDQDISGHDVDHEVTSRRGSALYTACGTGVVVSSSHHQAIKDIGNGLTATQWAPDGVIEGAEHDSLPIIGVLWHPEWSGDTGTGLLNYFMFTMCTSNSAR